MRATLTGGPSMLNVTVTGRNIELTPSLKEYLMDKLRRAQKHFDHPLEVTALLSVAKNRSIANSQTAEVTLKVNGHVIRGEESTENMYASIDLVADKIERQLRKFKTRYWNHSGKTKRDIDAEPVAAPMDTEEDEFGVVRTGTSEAVRPKLVRSKRFPLKPMVPEEAAAHMDLLGHDFFMFINSESGHVNTVYHRRDGNYGLIEPEA
jgi:putative sigma-54 modulation protein